MAKLGGTIVFVPTTLVKRNIDIKPYTIPLSCRFLSPPPPPSLINENFETIFDLIIIIKENKIENIFETLKKERKKKSI